MDNTECATYGDMTEEQLQVALKGLVNRVISWHRDLQKLLTEIDELRDELGEISRQFFGLEDGPECSLEDGLSEQHRHRLLAVAYLVGRSDAFSVSEDYAGLFDPRRITPGSDWVEEALPQTSLTKLQTFISDIRACYRDGHPALADLEACAQVLRNRVLASAMH